MLILVKGVEHLDEQDYQVWFSLVNQQSNAGLLNWDADMAHFFYRGGEINGVEDIVISIEPKGGSHAPTGPNALFIHFNK